MKFTRSTWITLFVAFILIAGTALGVMYNSANNARNLAQSNLTSARLQLTELNKISADLKTQLAQSDAEIADWQNKIDLLNADLGQAGLSLQQTQNKFPALAQTIEYNETLLGLARTSNLVVTKLTSTNTSGASLGTQGTIFGATTFTIELTGNRSDILSFIDRVATDGAFKTASLSPVLFQAPQPLTQIQKDAMRDEIKAELVAAVNAGLTAEKKVGIIERAILELLEEPSTSPNPTVEAMTKQIRDIISTEFGSNVADKLAADIALAIEENVADSLIGIVAQIYGDYIGQLIAAGHQDLIPHFLGKFGEEITTALGDNIASALPGEVINIINSKLEASVTQKIEALVSGDSIESRLAIQVEDAERPSAMVSITVYSYKGG